MKVGLIGTGLMGLPIAQRLMAANVPLVVYNRTSAKLESLRQAGAEVAASVGDLLQSTEAVIVMLSDAEAIRHTLLGEAAHLANRTILQMSTIAPSESQSIAQEVVAAGGEYLEAPVLGSIPEVKAGTLQIMVGSTPEQFEQWVGLLQHLGTPLHVGAIGSASALKLALNQLIGSLTTAFAQSLAFVQHEGVEVETFMQVLRKSALYAPTFDKKLQRMVESNYGDPNFPTKHLLKDVKLFVMEARAAGLQVDNLEGVDKILEIACNFGLADADYSALYAAIDPQSDLSFEENG